MKLDNFLKWPAFAFRQFNPKGEIVAVATVSVLYDIVDGNKLVLSPEQREIQLKDEFTGDMPLHHLVRQGDLVFYKPATDVTVIAQAWSPSGTPESSWDVGIKVTGEGVAIDKQLRVHGPRKWVKNAVGGWELSKAEPAKSVPLDYYHAFGGEYLDDVEIEGTAKDCNVFNPVGPGVIRKKNFVPEGAFRAPQIEAIDDPIKKPYGDYVPQGFAPIAPHWKFREQYAGTYDQKWIDVQHPFLPLDFDFHFNNCAHPDLIVKPGLTCRESIELTNLHPKHKTIKFKLPEIYIGAVARYMDKKSLKGPLVLDGLHIELLQAMPKVRLTYRALFPWMLGIRAIAIGQIYDQSKDEKQKIDAS